MVSRNRRFGVPPVTGTVQNLPNGEVQLIVEGSKEILDRFLAAVAERMAGGIDRVRVEKGPATGEFAGFEIRYSFS